MLLPLLWALLLCWAAARPAITLPSRSRSAIRSATGTIWRSSRDTFAIGAQNIQEIGEAYPLDTPEQIAANTAGYFHALSASTTDFSFTCDGQATEGGAYVQLYDSTTESFTTASAIPPQGAGYIELVCMVPSTWQQIGVTYTPTFVSGKTLNFTINASDLTKA